MKQTLIRCVLIGVAMLHHGSADDGAAPLQTQAVSSAPVELTIPAAPLPVQGNGQTQLAYELHITNFYVRDFTLGRLDVFAGEKNPAPLASFRGAEVTDLLERPLTLPYQRSQIANRSGGAAGRL